MKEPSDKMLEVRRQFTSITHFADVTVAVSLLLEWGKLTGNHPFIDSLHRFMEFINGDDDAAA